MDRIKIQPGAGFYETGLPKNVGLSENQSTQENTFTKFWFAEASLGEPSVFVWATFLEWAEYLRYHDDKTPLARSAFTFDPLARIF